MVELPCGHCLERLGQLVEHLLKPHEEYGRLHEARGGIVTDRLGKFGLIASVFKHHPRSQKIEIARLEVGFSKPDAQCTDGILNLIKRVVTRNGEELQDDSAEVVSHFLEVGLGEILPFLLLTLVNRGFAKEFGKSIHLRSAESEGLEDVISHDLGITRE